MIAEEAGVAEALIFRYFGSKRRLFSEAVNLSGARMVDGIARILEDDTLAPPLALRALLLYYLDTLARHPDLAKMVFLVSAELDDPELREAYTPHQERALHLIAHAVKRWQERGLLRPDPSPRAAAWLILGSYHTLALMKHSGRLDEVNVDLAVALVQPFIAPE